MTRTKLKPIPEGQRLLPYLSVRNAAAALDFYQRAFGAVEDYRLVEPGGRIGHAELTLAGARFMLAEEYPEYDSVGPQTVGNTTVSLLVYVEDVDAFVARAVAAGATLLRPVADQFYGDRVGWLKDPFGHKWSFASRVEEVSPEEMQRRFSAMMGGQGG